MKNSIRQFIKCKRYIFDKETALNDDSFKCCYYTNEFNIFWVNYCDGKEVEFIDVLDGVIKSPEKNYLIAPWWCVKVV